MIRRDCPKMIFVSRVMVGDLLDLRSDKIADPEGDNPYFESELAVVCGIERATTGCIFVDIEGVDSFGFPPDHVVMLHGHDEEYDEVQP